MSPKELPFLLAGQWLHEGKLQERYSPYQNQLIARVWEASQEHLERAISAAVDAFEVTRSMPCYERQRILRKVAAALAGRKEELARTIALEAGKPIKTARTEVERAVLTFEIAAEESTRIGGEYLPMEIQESGKGKWALVRRFPIGPVAAITPFNFPLNLVAHKVAPAMAAGCSVVLKPAPQTPLSALELGKIITEAGWPAGGLNVLPLADADAAALVEDDRLKLLSFTGSAKVGWALKARSGKKRVVLELGGNAGVIIHNDADLGHAAKRCAIGGFTYAGQSCISVQRIFVQRESLDEFLDVFLPKVQILKMGDPLDESTDVGPLIRNADADRVEQWISQATSQGARILCGGTREGNLLSPTVLTGTRPDQLVNCEEIFAPLVTVEPYTIFDEAMARVNSSRYGLQAGVFTYDSRRIFAAYEKLEVGGVMINDVPTFRMDHMPYGGVKDSGLGREGVRYSIEDMTEMKILVMDQGTS